MSIKVLNNHENPENPENTTTPPNAPFYYKELLELLPNFYDNPRYEPFRP